MTSKTPSEQFWERHYRGLQRPPTGRPSAVLVEYASKLSPGRSLDLGCSRGDDVIWLARQGWQSTGVDVSPHAVQTATARAAAAGVSDRTRFEAHDLSVRFPGGSFDLVSALFFQSPVEFPREAVLRRAAASVTAGGLLLIVDHASVAPWSWSAGTQFPTAEQTLDGIGLDLAVWDRVFVGTVERTATGPNRQTALVSDNILALRRRA
tara:strand:- start:5038 stop:5661 length:624 start_codon:yes stop_codon:yes gene_type:complete